VTNPIDCDDHGGHDWQLEFRGGDRRRRCTECRVWYDQWQRIMADRLGDGYLSRLVANLVEEVFG